MEHTNKLYRSDCKYVMQGISDSGKKVDFIYLDPPFNSSRIYNLIFNGGGISAQSKAFHDMWNFTARARQLSLDFINMIDQLNDVSDPFKAFIRAWVNILQSGSTDDKKLLNYLIYMTERLIIMKRLMSPRASIMFHCDPTASHYIKVIMDGVFGKFINEIIWYYKNASRGKKKLANSHDVILWYAKDKDYVFNRDDVLVPFESGMTEWRYTKGGQKERKMPKGKTPDDVIVMPSLNARAKERRGYETQKPKELLKKLIATACPKDGVVLDPFCGCGTTIEAAIELGRGWVGIDISGDAVNEIEARIQEITVPHLANLCKHETIESSPETMREYNRLKPFEKQDWLIRRIGGFPNPKKVGDAGVDGEITIHIGDDKFDKMIFSVKTGKSVAPAMVRELRGTMQQEKAVMGGLILDVNPTAKMEEGAERVGIFQYSLETTEGVAKQDYPKLQILTAQEIIDGKRFTHPPTLGQKKNEKRHRGNLGV